MLDPWEKKPERPDCDIVDMFRGEIVTISMLKLVLAARRPRRRPERRITHMVKEVTESVGAREEDPEDAIRWRQMIRCDDP